VESILCRYFLCKKCSAEQTLFFSFLIVSIVILCLLSNGAGSLLLHRPHGRFVVVVVVGIFPGLSPSLCVVATSEWPNQDRLTVVNPSNVVGSTFVEARRTGNPPCIDIASRRRDLSTKPWTGHQVKKKFLFSPSKLWLKSTAKFAEAEALGHHRAAVTSARTIPVIWKKKWTGSRSSFNVTNIPAFFRRSAPSWVPVPGAGVHVERWRRCPRRARHVASRHVTSPRRPHRGRSLCHARPQTLARSRTSRDARHVLHVPHAADARLVATA
jgi:hypothetical protein